MDKHPEKREKDLALSVAWGSTGQKRYAMS